MLATAHCQDQDGVGAWSEAGHGNRRAVVWVDEKADAVLGRDSVGTGDLQPETKDVKVFNLATGELVKRGKSVGRAQQARS